MKRLPLNYEAQQPDEDCRSPLAFRSLAVGVVSWVVGQGGIALWDSRTVPRPPLPADFDHDLWMVAIALPTLIFGPLIGMHLALLSMKQQPARQGTALIGLVLNFAVWGYPIAL